MKSHKITLIQRSSLIVWLALAAYIIPLAVFFGLGLYFAYILEILPEILISLTLVTLVLVFIKIGFQKSLSKELSVCSDQRLLAAASPNWSAQEKVIWSASGAKVDELLLEDDDWIALQNHAIQIARFVAEKFNRKELDMTIPEALRAIEVVSQRFRKEVKENLPANEYIRLSHLRWGYDVYENYGSTAKQVYKAYRVSRVAINPFHAMLSEIKSILLESLSNSSYENLSQNLKKLFLQEVASVCIDLYSGRLSFDEGDLHETQASVEDQQKMFKGLEPLRVVIVGQVSAGKSSLINRIKQDIVADVDIVPSTSGILVYDFLLDGVEAFSLVDLPGIDGQEKSQKLILKELKNADIVFWVLKANQSARKLDKELLELFRSEDASIENRSVKMPNIIGILNQTDRLIANTSLDYDFDYQQPKTDKEKLLHDALQYNQQLLGLEFVLPLVCKDEATAWGLDELETVLIEQLSSAKSKQLNRESIELMNSNTAITEQFSRLFRGTSKLIKSGLKKN